MQSTPSSSKPSPQLPRRERIESRNKVLVARYYYWTEIRRRRFDDVIRILSQEEFFVEDRTICNTIGRMSDYLDSLYRTGASPGDLALDYPSWCWRASP
jgi:hypothetical protein